MKVVCINSTKVNIGFDLSDQLTKGKIYDVISQHDMYYHIKDDTNLLSNFLKSRFISLEEYRENLIEEIIK
jgi:hypothetical protein